ncbi:MAG: putative Ig domain-containing protein, partial [Synechococcus lacustris]
MPATVTSISASRSRVALGGSATFSATVTGTNPGGTVTFFDGTNVLGTGAVDASGIATFTTTALPVGAQAVTAVYGGDGSNDPSTSPPITVEVGNDIANGGFQADAPTGTGYTTILGGNSTFASQLSAQLVPVAATRSSAVAVDLVFISPEIFASVPQEELAGARVVILDPYNDVIGQVGSALQANPGTSVVRLISHGEPGSLLLAGQQITRDILLLRAEDIAGWRQDLAPDADIFLYGCSVAATPEGRSLVDLIATLTGADVAASSNLTGAPAKGGDLAFEYESGSIEATSGRFAPAWDQSGLLLGAPVFNGSSTGTFTRTLPGSFTPAASGATSYAIGQRTFFDANFSTLPEQSILGGTAALSAGALVLNPVGNNNNGSFILPKLGANSPGSFTATFDYDTTTNGGGNGASFNYGLISPPNLNYQNGLVATAPNSGLSVNLIGLTNNPRIDVTWGGPTTVVASAPVTFTSAPTPVEIKLDGANILTVRYGGVEKLRMNLADKVNAADRSNWQFALGSGTGGTTNSNHAIDNLKIVSNGELPAGLTLNPSTGEISGTPTTANRPGTQTFELVASNAEGSTAQLVNLQLKSGAPEFTSSATNPMLPGIDGTFTVVAAGTAGTTTYGLGRTIISTTLADATSLPLGAYVTGSANFEGGDLDLTQNGPSQNGRLQFQGEGAQNPNSFSASFNYKLGDGTTVGGDSFQFFYGAPGLSSQGIYFQIKEFTAGSGASPGNNTNLVLSVFNNGTSISVGNAPNAATSTSISFPNSYLPTASGYNFLPIRLNMSAEGRLQAYINNVLAFDAGNVPNWQTIDKSLWAFGVAATNSSTNTSFHTIKDLTIATTGVVPAGMTFDTTTGVLSGELGVGTSVDTYLPITATNAAGTTNQTLKLDVSASNLLPGQRPGNGASVGSPSSSVGNAVGVTGYQFRNLTAFAALKNDGSVTVWGDTANGGKQADAPTATGYTSIVSNEKAFAALRNDGSIFAWGNNANGATGEPTGTGFQRIAASRNAFAALKSDGSITVWGASNGGGLPNSATTAPTGIIYPPTTTGFIRLFANEGGFAAQRVDGTIVSWGNGSATATSVTPNRPDSTWTFGNRVVPNGFADKSPTTTATNTFGAFAGVRPISGATNNIAAWGNTTIGGTTDAPGAVAGKAVALSSVVDIVATSRAFAEMDINGQIVSWGDSLFGGTGYPLDSGYRQIYASNGAFVAVRQDGSLTAWGSSNNGGTGAPSGTGYTQVFSTLNAFAALKANGSISVWGNSNFGGASTAPPATTGYTTIASTNSAFAALKSDGSITVWGNSADGGKNGPAGTGWLEITSNESSFTARNKDGSLFSWGSSLSGGSNSKGTSSAPTGNFLTVQSPTLEAPYFPLAAGAPTSFRIDQREITQIFPGIQGDGLNFSISSGSLPPGMSFDPVTSYIYGAAAKPGNYSFTINATGPAGSLSQAFTMKVESATLPNERQGSGAAYTMGTGKQFPNDGAYVGLGVNGNVTAWGNSLTGGSGAPTGTGYTQVISNKKAFAALRSDGSITAWGDSTFGGSNAPTATGFREITATQSAFAALKADGSITVWGNTYSGGSNAPSSTITGFQNIYAGLDSFAAIKADGSITVWGDSTYLATGTPTATGYTKITPNKNAFAALKTDGSITAWGNSAGGGGTGAPTATGYTTIFASDGAYAALKNDGSIAVWGASASGGSSGPSGTNFVDVWSSLNGFSALRTDGSLVSWGASGTLNSAAPSGTGFAEVFSTTNAFAALKADGSISTWGNSANGGTGAPAGTGYTQVFSNAAAFAALKADGSIATWGNSANGATGAPTGSGYTQIFSRTNSFAAMKADGTVVSWGLNASGGSPLAFTSLQNATSVLPSRESGITGTLPNIPQNAATTTVYAGLNGVAGLQVGGFGVGVGTALTSGSLPPGITLNVATGYLEGTATTAGAYTFTVTSYNESGQSSQAFKLIVANNTATSAPSWLATTSIGYPNYTIGQAVSYNLAGSVANSTYQVVAGALPPGLALNTTSGAVNGTPTVPGIYQFTLASSNKFGAAAQVFTIAVNDGTLPNERIGQGSTLAAQTTGRQGLNEAAFAALQADGTIVSWGASTHGGAGAAGVPTDNGYVQIAQSSRAFAALNQDGSIRSWGDGAYGGTGAPTDLGYTRVYASASAFAAMKANGSVTTWGAAASGGTGTPTGTGFTQIFTGSNAMAAMNAAGSITAWGDASSGGTGAPTTTGYTTITANGTAFAALKSDGSIAVWGNSSNGGTNGPTNNGFIAVYSTPLGFAALRGDGTITTWGSTNAGDKAFPGGNNFVSISSNSGAYAALNTSGSIVAWGSSTKGGSNFPTGTGYTAIYSNKDAFAALKADGSITAWGGSTSGATGAPVGTGYTKIYSNQLAFVAMKADGSIKSWGNANYGGVGKAPLGTGFTQVFSTAQAFAAQKADGSITVWGAPASGGSGAPTDTGLSIANSLATQPSYQAAGVTGRLPTAYAGTSIGPEGGAGVSAYQVGALGTGVWSRITAGSVPGMNLNPATGLLSGTPTTAGTYTFTVGSSGSQGTLSQVFTLEVKAPL